MRKIHVGRLLPMLSLLAVGFILGGTFADAGNGDSPMIDLEIEACDRVLDTVGRVVVEKGRGFVVFTDTGGEKDGAKVEVRGWDALAKRGLVDEGTPVHVSGANNQGKKVEYRGHVTVLK